MSAIVRGLSGATLVTFLRQLRNGCISRQKGRDFPASIALIGMRNIREAYPQLVLQAFLQRVINGGGEIIREMALGKRAMDLGVLFRGAKYAVECKKVSFYERSHEKAYDQVCGYMDRLGVDEGWLVVFDPDLSKPWEDKIYTKDLSWNGKTVHLVGC